MFSTSVPLVKIKTASIGDDSRGSRSNNYSCGGGYIFWMNRARILWGQIDQALRCEVDTHWRSNKSTQKARKQVMWPYFMKT
jgi:hypothetical protein